MEKEKRIKPTGDLAFKKVFGTIGNEDIIEGLIEDFFDIKPKEIVIKNPYDIKAYSKLDVKTGEEYVILRQTLKDVGATFSAGDFTAEMQIQSTDTFGKRMLYYPFSLFCSNHDAKGTKYDDLIPVYAINILTESYFKQSGCVKRFAFFDEYSGKPMEEQYIKIACLELRKESGYYNKHQEYWGKYFNGNEIPKESPDYIKKAEQIIEKSNLGKEELEMLTLTEKYEADQHALISTAINKGKKELAEELIKAGVDPKLIESVSGLPRKPSV